ncbi:MAG TPA: DUF2946 family protein [Burkholderiaceae bacterium]|nr:DUF2946 family protein [Burkholderiaceae bacterium]
MTFAPLRSPLARRPAPWPWQPRRWLLVLVWALWVLATLAPGLSRLGAHARATPSDWVEVCTRHGTAWVRADAVAVAVVVAVSNPVADPAAGLLAPLDACGHCSLALDRFTPPLPAVLAWTGLPQAPLRVVSHLPPRRWVPPSLEFSARGPPVAS